MQKKQKPSFRNNVIEIAKEQYHTEPEYPWAKSPEHVVFRHSSNKKWYALIMSVPRNKLGLEGRECVDVLNVKADAVMAGAFLMGKGVFPGYHMNKANWITILLDGTVPMKTIELLLDVSYELTKKKTTKKAVSRNTEFMR